MRNLTSGRCFRQNSSRRRVPVPAWALTCAGSRGACSERTRHSPALAGSRSSVGCGHVTWSRGRKKQDNQGFDPKQNYTNKSFTQIQVKGPAGAGSGSLNKAPRAEGSSGGWRSQIKVSAGSVSPWLVDSRLLPCLHVSSRVYLCPNSSYKDTLMTPFNLLTSCRTLPPNKVIF